MKEQSKRRAAQHDLKLPVRFEYDENGKLHLHFDTDVALHFHGEKTETIDGSSVDFVKGDQFVITSGSHHTNPWGAEFYDQVIERMLQDDDLREVMEAKLQLHKEQQVKLHKERKFDRLRERLFKRQRKGKCSCE